MAKGSVTIHVLLIEKEDGWIAQCLDYDIVAQAQTFADLLPELHRLVVSHIAASLELGREPFAGFKRAPKKYWDLYERAPTRIEATEKDRLPLPFIPSVRVTNVRELETVSYG